MATRKRGHTLMQQAPTTHMTTERRFTAIRIGVMRSAEFVQLTGLLMYGKHEIVDDIPTACTLSLIHISEPTRPY